MAYTWTSGTEAPPLCFAAGDLVIPRVTHVSGAQTPDSDSRGLHLRFKPVENGMGAGPGEYGGEVYSPTGPADPLADPVVLELDLRGTVLPLGGEVRVAGLAAGATYRVRFERVRDAWRTVHRELTMTLRNLRAVTPVKIPRNAYAVMCSEDVSPSFAFGNESVALPLPAGRRVELGDMGNIKGATVAVTTQALTFWIGC